jgi:hypothetical protein
MEKGSLIMLAHYCWSLIRETSTGEYKGQKRLIECLMTTFL